MDFGHDMCITLFAFAAGNLFPVKLLHDLKKTRNFQLIGVTLHDDNETLFVEPQIAQY